MMRSCAAYTSELNSRRLFSPEKPGPDGTTWQSRSPSPDLRAGAASRVSSSPVSEYQSVTKSASMPGDHRPLEPRHVVLPVQPATAVTALLVRRFDDVLRAGERHCAVDDEQLAVVAQVGALDEEPPRLERQHEVPLHSHRLEPADGAAIPGIREVAKVVEQHPHPHAALVRGLQRIEERGRRVVERQDVELGMDGSLGQPDLGDHRLERDLVVGPHHRLVAADERHRTELAVQLDDGLQPGRPGRVATHPVEALGRLQDVVVHLALPPSPVAGQPRPAEHQEQDDADVGLEEDQQQPGQRRLRPPVSRHEDEREHPDRDVENEQRRSRARRRTPGWSSITACSRTAARHPGPCP